MPGSPGNPSNSQSIPSLKPFGTAIVPLAATETTVLPAADQTQVVEVSFKNIDTASRTVTLYMKLVTAGTAAAAADSNTLEKAFPIVAGGLLTRQITVPKSYILTALASVANVVNAQVSGGIER